MKSSCLDPMRQTTRQENTGKHIHCISMSLLVLSNLVTQVNVHWGENDSLSVMDWQSLSLVVHHFWRWQGYISHSPAKNKTEPSTLLHSRAGTFFFCIWISSRAIQIWILLAQTKSTGFFKSWRKPHSFCPCPALPPCGHVWYQRGLQAGQRAHCRCCEKRMKNSLALESSQTGPPESGMLSHRLTECTKIPQQFLWTCEELTCCQLSAELTGMPPFYFCFSLCYFLWSFSSSQHLFENITVPWTWLVHGFGVLCMLTVTIII